MPHIILFQTWLTITFAKRIRLVQKEIQNVHRTHTTYTLNADQRHYKYTFVLWNIACRARRLGCRIASLSYYFSNLKYTFFITNPSVHADYSDCLYIHWRMRVFAHISAIKPIEQNAIATALHSQKAATKCLAMYGLRIWCVFITECTYNLSYSHNVYKHILWIVQ